MMAVVVLVWSYHDVLVGYLWAEPAGASTDAPWYAEVGHWLLGALHWLVEVLIALVMAVVGLVVVVMTSTVLASPFNDALSEKVEELTTGVKGPPFRLAVVARDAVRTVALELVKWLGLYAPVMLVLWIVSLVVPVVGPVVLAVVGFLFSAWFLALDYIDWPASRRNEGIGERFKVLGRHPMATLGFGSGVWVFLFIPLVNLLFMPAAVAGGTLLFLDLTAAGSKEGPAQGSENTGGPVPAH